jgi:hypothetical protein
MDVTVKPERSQMPNTTHIPTVRQAESRSIPEAKRRGQPPARHASDTNHWPCEDVLVLKEKVAALESWRSSTETDLKAILAVISQVKLLMSLSIGGGGLSIISLIVTIAALASLLR